MKQTPFVIVFLLHHLLFFLSYIFENKFFMYEASGTDFLINLVLSE